MERALDEERARQAEAQRQVGSLSAQLRRVQDEARLRKVQEDMDRAAEMRQ